MKLYAVKFTDKNKRDWWFDMELDDWVAEWNPMCLFMNKGSAVAIGMADQTNENILVEYNMTTHSEVDLLT